MTICVGDQLLDIKKPIVMGILNCTPDSFFLPSRKQGAEEICGTVRQMLSQGAQIIDIGGCSTRPGGELATEADEKQRVQSTLSIIQQRCKSASRDDYAVPAPTISLDTFRASIAREMVQQFGPMIINDVTSGGDPEMFPTVAELGVPYVLTSCASNLSEMMRDFAEKIQRLRDLGQKDIILDPGFGFGKSFQQNYEILGQLSFLQEFGLPLMIGLSRKSMICNLLGCNAENALNGTSVLNTIALQQLDKGNVILRVHDVKPAIETIALIQQLRTAQTKN